MDKKKTVLKCKKTILRMEIKTQSTWSTMEMQSLIIIKTINNLIALLLSRNRKCTKICYAFL